MEQEFFMRSIRLTISVLVFFSAAILSAQTTRRSSSYEEMAGNLSNQVRLLQDENAKLAGTVYMLQQEMKTLQQRLRSYQAELEDLRRQIAVEKEAREKQLGHIADQIQKAGEQSQTSAGQEEEFDYYVVEAGATLSAISRATGISIARLKKVNNLTSDTLRIDQKLKIPRK